MKKFCELNRHDFKEFIEFVYGASAAIKLMEYDHDSDSFDVLVKKPDGDRETVFFYCDTCVGSDFMDEETRINWQKFLFAKGVLWQAENNPFLKNE